MCCSNEVYSLTKLRLRGGNQQSVCYADYTIVGASDMKERNSFAEMREV